MTAPGWYFAEGDPPGTTRYWDGEQWVGDPQHSGPAAPGGYTPGDSGGGRYDLASPGARIGARLIDFVIAGIIFVILLGSAIGDFTDGLDELGSNPEQAEIQALVEDIADDYVGRLAAFSLIGILWDFLWVGLLGGTPGKLMLGLRVARADNGVSPPGWAKAALRSLNRVAALVPVIGSFAVLLTGLASLVMLFADSQHRTVMDRVASTVVVRK